MELLLDGHHEGKMGIFDIFDKKKKTKPRPDFSNVRTGASSTAPKPEAARPPAPPATTIHVVVAGESLSKIAKQHYGNANEWPSIFEANRDKIKDPDRIYPGQELQIPRK